MSPRASRLDTPPTAARKSRAGSPSSINLCMMVRTLQFLADRIVPRRHRLQAQFRKSRHLIHCIACASCSNLDPMSQDTNPTKNPKKNFLYGFAWRLMLSNWRAFNVPFVRFNVPFVRGYPAGTSWVTAGTQLVLYRRPPSSGPAPIMGSDDLT